MLRELQEVTTYVSFDPRGFYIKNGQDPNGNYVGQVQDEFSSYQTIKPFIDTPKFRFLPGENPRLVTMKVDGTCVLDTESKDAVPGLLRLNEDLLSMWQTTGTPMDEEVVMRNLRQESINTLMAVREVLPSSTTEKVLNRLHESRDPIMTLNHGDENFKNIFIKGDRYKLIDPRFAGYYSPSTVLNNMTGTAYLFFPEKTDGLKPVFADMEEKISSLSDKPFLTREYLYANIMRGAIGRVNVKNLATTEARKEEYPKIAEQIYYEGFK